MSRIAPEILEAIQKRISEKWGVELFYTDLNIPGSDMLNVESETVGKICDIYDDDGKFVIEYDSGDTKPSIEDEDKDEDGTLINNNIVWEYEYGNPKSFDPEFIVDKLYSLYCRDRDINIDIEDGDLFA